MLIASPGYLWSTRTSNSTEHYLARGFVALARTPQCLLLWRFGTLTFDDGSMHCLTQRLLIVVVQMDEWGLVEGGHDLDIADTQVRIAAPSIFLRLLNE